MSEWFWECSGRLIVKNREAAFAKIAEMTEGLRVFLGTGNPCYEPHARVCWDNNWTAWVSILPIGDNGPIARTLIKCEEF